MESTRSGGMIGHGTREARATRRQVVRAVTTIAAGAAFLRPNGALAARMPGDASSPVKRPRTVWDVMGIHDAPNVGGSRNLQVFERHLGQLGAKWVIGIMPSREWYKSVANIGAVPITRLLLPRNRLDERLLGSLLAEVPPQSLVIPFNEPNLLGETGTPLLPAVHAEELIRAAEIVADQGGTTLISPLAQEGALLTGPNALLYEANYFAQMLAGLVSLKSPEWIRAHMALAFHDYHLKYNPTKGAEPFDRLRHYYFDFVQPTVGDLDVYVTEGGYFLADTPAIDYQAVADDTRSLLGTALPPDLSAHVKMWALWLYANLFQRPVEDQRDTEAQRLERTAFWQLGGPTPLYNAVVDYARQQNPAARAAAGVAGDLGAS